MANVRTRTNIRDVAKESGVSLTTVSLVLNKNDQRISEGTRQRVLAAIEKLNYTPSRLARGLPNRRANTLAILVPALQNAFADVYFGEIISGIYEVAADRGFRIMLEVARRDYVRRKAYLQLMEDCSVDGILFIGATEEHRWLTDFREHDLPFVVVNNHFPEWDLDAVVCDYPAAGRLAAEHLTELGHRRIGHIAGPMTMIGTSRELTAGFVAELERRDVRLGSRMIVDGQYQVETGKLAARELLSRDPKLTAIFAGNDKMALGAYQALREAGLKPGEDVSVLGCDDIPNASLADPPLTTIRMHFYDAGARSCGLLMELIDARTAPLRKRKGANGRASSVAGLGAGSAEPEGSGGGSSSAVAAAPAAAGAAAKQREARFERVPVTLVERGSTSALS